MCYTWRVEALAALADDTRRAILALLTDGERTAGEIATHFPVTRPAVSRHLRVLRESGLVRVRADGRRRLYALDPTPLADLDAWLATYRPFWSNRLDALDTEVRRGLRDAREEHP